VRPPRQLYWCRDTNVPDFGYLTHTDDSHGQTVCTPVAELEQSAKLSYYAARLIDLLLAL
jgi:hypothetical protein